MSYFNEEFKISASTVKQFIFCERCPWYALVANIHPVMPEWVHEGRDWHVDQKIKQKRNQHPKGWENAEQAFNVPLQEDRYNVYGIADEILYLPDSKQALVIEHKRGQGKPYLNEIMQLYTYAYCLEQSRQWQCKEGYILKSNVWHKVVFTEKLKHKFITTVQRLHQTLQQSHLPHSNATEKQCAQCEYLRFCNDR